MKYRPARHGSENDTDTPLMQQYASIKSKYPDAILLFRIGDFYETFGEDAVKTAATLGITLTKRRNGAASEIDLAGFPYHALDTYLHKLVRGGHRVAICDQLEDPKFAKKIVKRGITELVTPGVSYNDKILDHKTNNFLASVYFENKNAGISFLDISTGEFLVADGTIEYAEKLLHNFKPSEILFQKSKKKDFTELFGSKFYTYGLDEWIFTNEYSTEILLKHFGTTSLKGFGIENMNFGIIAAGSALHYLAATQHDRVQHIQSISRIEEENYVWLDKFTIRNLELFRSSNEKAKALIDILDCTITPMGSRLMKRWIAMPLKEKQPIEERLNIVEFFLNHAELVVRISEQLNRIGDLERLISKVATGRISPRELVHLKRAMIAVEQVKKECDAPSINGEVSPLLPLGSGISPCHLIRERIEKEIVPDPPSMLNKGKVISDGVSAELDDIRKIMRSGKEYLVQIQQREIQRTGISSLKIGYNTVFGYYLEVTHTHKNKVPSDWIRKQTLTNAERYITEELKQYEEKILGAEEKILQLETRLFNGLVLSLSDYISPIQFNASLIAKLDCLLSLAEVSKKNNYTRPKIYENRTLYIHSGRHPVIETQLPHGEAYIPNDIYLDNEQQQIMIITGPNMSGKSAILRQTALIVIMAQMGSFVSSQNADIGIIDKIFTRVGASDNLSLGESTFMVEMNETASILNNLSERSLILLDEIGRGTSTYDGISIAWAIAEYLHGHPAKPKTLFATHYHELNEMEKTLPGIKNFNVSVKEVGNQDNKYGTGKVIFLRKLVPGGSEHSFGIHVAKMAGIPKRVVGRANEILEKLEGTREQQAAGGSSSQQQATGNMQLSFFQLNDPVLEQIHEEILKTDINTLTPIEALMKLNEIKRLISR